MYKSGKCNYEQEVVSMFVILIYLSYAFLLLNVSFVCLLVRKTLLIHLHLFPAPFASGELSSVNEKPLSSH